MKCYFGYIRVSTAKQGTHGVSLVEQRAAIERYASRTGLSIVQWFEERETASKQGRPIFGRMLSLLRKGKANGVVIHKIDRSARNLKDWADLGDLIDAGIDVHFAADALDLSSRGGRLSADLQAVISADFIRNLREETKKGFYGRLKQGFYPLPAPIGYVDQGGGKEKSLDPRTAPLVRKAFEVYATGRYSLRTLVPELERIGLRNRRGGVLSRSGLAKMLANPFYCGLIRLRKSGETFKGAHTPLISVALFDGVQTVLRGKTVKTSVRHQWRFRRLLRCGLCGYALIGELQKGRVYYRCHTSRCATACIREDAVDTALRQLYACIQLIPDEVEEARRYFAQRLAQQSMDAKSAEDGLRLQLSDAKARVSRLTDALVDGLLDRRAFEDRREALLMDIARLEERLHCEQPPAQDRAEKFLELAASLISSHDLANGDEQRELAKITTSNFVLTGKSLAITPSEPFSTLAIRHSVYTGAPKRARPRTSCQAWQLKAIRTFVDSLIGVHRKVRRDTVHMV